MSPHDTNELRYAVIEETLFPEVVTNDLAGGSRGIHELQVGTDGVPRVAYVAGIGPANVDAFRPHLAERTGSPWQIEPVHAVDDFDDTRELTFTLGADGTPHVAWNDYYDAESLYAFRDQGTWTTEPFASFGNSTPDLAITLDTDGAPLIATWRVVEGVTWELYVTKRLSEGSWATNPVEENTLIIELSIAVGSDGARRLAYRSSNAATVRYGVRTDTGWERASLGGNASTVRMALGPDDRLHLVWQAWDVDDVLYATWD